MIKSVWLRLLLVLSLLIGAGLSLAACAASEEDIRNWKYVEDPLSEEDKILMAAEKAGFFVQHPNPDAPSTELVERDGDWAGYGYLDAHREDGFWKFGCATKPFGKGEFYEINGDNANDKIITEYWFDEEECPIQPWLIEQVKKKLADLSTERL